MSLLKPSAKIWIDCDKKKLMLSAPFNSYFNLQIRNLPRFFNKETKIWEFDLEFADKVVDIALKCWSNVIRPPFLLMEIFEYLTEEDLKDMYANLSKRHRNDGDKTLLTLISKFFVDYIDLTEVVKKRRLIRLESSNTSNTANNYYPNIDLEIRSLFLENRDHQQIEPREAVIGSLVDVQDEQDD
jgi:hypothetical protein